MTLLTVVAYLALLAFVVYRRMRGRATTSLRQLAILPVILSLIGVEDLGKVHLNHVDVAVTVIGCALSLGLGALRGSADRIEERAGSPWVRWGGTSLAIFAVNIAAKLALDVGGVAAGGTSKGVTASLLLAVGLMLVGENGVLALRLGDRISMDLGAGRQGLHR